MSHAYLPDASDGSLASRLSARLVRVCWLIAGYVALVLLAAHIALDEESFLVGTDLVFWLTVAFLLGVRYLDITRLHGQTIHHEPATLNHWRDYAAVTVMFALGLWLLSHGLAMLAGSV